MPNTPLSEFIALNREEIIRRCQAKVAMRSMPPPTDAELNHGVPLFLDQLVDALRMGLRSSPQIERSAILHGHERLLQGFTVSQVVMDYGDVCQSVTGLALEKNAPIDVEDFRTLNKCLDDAIAGAVTEFGSGRDQSTHDAESARGTERVAFLAHRGRHLTDTAILAFVALQSGKVGVSGSTAAVLQHTLTSMRELMSRALGEAHCPQSLLNREKFMVAGFINEVAAAAILDADTNDVALTVMPIEHDVMIEADRSILAAVVGNLLKNAVKFTGSHTTVTLRVATSAERVLIEVGDECGGLDEKHLTVRSLEELPAGGATGIGLALSRWGAEANNGRIYARNLPDKGCVFTVDLPRAA